ncbi:MAG: hypothetical protein AAB436_04710 [Patescibacteria group bacterium]
MSGEVHKSTLQEASDLPVDAPHVLSVASLGEGEVVGGAAAVIDIDEFETALRDVKDPITAAGYFALEADAYRKQLREEGRSA